MYSSRELSLAKGSGRRRCPYSSTREASAVARGAASAMKACDISSLALGRMAASFCRQAATKDLQLGGPVAGAQGAHGAAEVPLGAGARQGLLRGTACCMLSCGYRGAAQQGSARSLLEGNSEASLCAEQALPPRVMEAWELLASARAPRRGLISRCTGLLAGNAGEELLCRRAGCSPCTRAAPLGRAHLHRGLT